MTTSRSTGFSALDFTWWSRNRPFIAALAGVIAFLCLVSSFSWSSAARPGLGPLPGSPGALPAATSTPTPAPGTGSLAVTVWEDVDSNGSWDDDERLLSGVQIRVTRQDQPGAGIALLTGVDGAIFVQGLLPGTYVVAATPPPGYLFTALDSYVVRIGDGQILSIGFGMERAPTATPTPPPILDASDATIAYCGGIYSGNNGTGRSQVQYYGCRPAWNESGPEVVYRIELAANQPLTVSLSSATSDLDLFLLRYVYPDSCVAGGDTYLTYPAEAGVYLLAVDGYRGAVGDYSLRVDCPLGVQATATPSLTPSPVPTSTVAPSATPTVPAAWHLYLPILLARQ